MPSLGSRKAEAVQPDTRLPEPDLEDTSRLPWVRLHRLSSGAKAIGGVDRSPAPPALRMSRHHTPTPDAEPAFPAHPALPQRRRPLQSSTDRDRHWAGRAAPGRGRADHRLGWASRGGTNEGGQQRGLRTAREMRCAGQTRHPGGANPRPGHPRYPPVLHSELDMPRQRWRRAGGFRWNNLEQVPSCRPRLVGVGGRRKYAGEPAIRSAAEPTAAPW